MNIKNILEYTQKLTVLYIEDEIEVCHGGRDILIHYYKSVDIAYDGQEGWEKYSNSLELEEISYDLVITDITMPKLNGIELSRLILTKNPQQAIIIISAHDDSKYLMEAIDMGISGFLNKPINYEKLSRVLYKTSIAISDRKFVSTHMKYLENLTLELESKNNELNELNQKLENASNTDALTGLYNRRYFNTIFAKEMKRAKRLNSNITFMMADVDFFKQYNDIYGHIQGDSALIGVAKVLNSVLKRPTDFVFRLGGEEFGILITDTNIQESENIANRLCQEMLGCKIEHKGSIASEFLTISIGVVNCLITETIDEENILKKADSKLYEAKALGRNCYII